MIIARAVYLRHLTRWRLDIHWKVCSAPKPTTFFCSAFSNINRCFAPLERRISLFCRRQSFGAHSNIAHQCQKMCKQEFFQNFSFPKLLVSRPLMLKQTVSFQIRIKKLNDGKPTEFQSVWISNINIHNLLLTQIPAFEAGDPEVRL